MRWPTATQPFFGGHGAAVWPFRRLPSAQRLGKHPRRGQQPPSSSVVATEMWLGPTGAHCQGEDVGGSTMWPTGR